MHQPSRIMCYCHFIRIVQRLMSNNSRNVASLLRQEEEPQRRQPPRNNIKPNNLPEQVENPSFRISRKKKEPSEVDSEVESYQVMSPSIHAQPQLQRLVQMESKRIKKLAQQLQTTRGKVDDLEYRLANKVDGSRETIQMIRSLQEQYSSEMMAVKSSLQERRIEEHAAMMKEKEKATALFLEVVRLGDAFEKMQNNMKGLGGGVEDRLQYLEGKLLNNDKNMMSLATRNTTGNDMVAQFTDKVMSRVHSVENNLLLLSRQHMKDKEQVSRIDSSTSRIAENLNILLRNMQSDIQYKLENRVSEMVNKIMFEKEERMRSQDEIRKNLDFRERLLMEKQRSEKEQLESRYLSMDTNIRNQFMRKDQSIKALQDFTEAEMRSLQSRVQDAAKVKEQSEAFFKGEIKKVQESFRKEYDMHKQQQYDFVSNMEEMIKVEIGARLNSDVDLKNLTNSVATYLATDLNTLKEVFNRFSKETSSTIREIESSSSARDSQLSHYVDQQISESMANVGEKYNKMKTVFTKLTQQFRTHLLTTETNRKSIDTRLEQNQKDFDRLRGEINGIIDDFHKDLEIKLKEEKENSGAAKEAEITSRVNKLEDYLNHNIDALKEGLENSKNIITNRFDMMKNLGSNDLKELSERVATIKVLIEELKSEEEQQISELKQIIAMNEQKVADEIEDIRQKMAEPASNYQDNENSNNRNSDLQSMADVEELKGLIKRMEKEAEINREDSNDNFKKIHEDVTIAYNNISELENIFKSGLQNMEEQVFKVKNELVILQAQVKGSEVVVRQDIQRLIQMMEGDSRVTTP